MKVEVVVQVEAMRWRMCTVAAMVVTLGVAMTVIVIICCLFFCSSFVTLVATILLGLPPPRLQQTSRHLAHNTRKSRRLKKKK